MGKLFNRAADRWRALYTRRAALIPDNEEAKSLGLQLLEGYQFGVRDRQKGRLTEYQKQNGFYLGSAFLVEKLVAMEGRPWAEMGKSRNPLTQHGLARLLLPYKIWPSLVGPDEARLRGYPISKFSGCLRA
jgi:Protein of unknown function (DUF3631)